MLFDIKCKKCNCGLEFGKFQRLEDLDFTRLGVFCLKCFVIEDEKLKQSRFVEEYDGNKIYCKDDKYTPYWQSSYYFLNIEDARLRIDDKTSGIYSPLTLG